MYKKVLAVLLFILILVTNGWTQESKQLKMYTTDGTSLTNEDIMRSFVNEVRTYLQRYDRYDCYYLVVFKVYQEAYTQDFAWRTSTSETVHQWGTIYTIRLLISNASLWVQFCNRSFSSDGQDAREIATTRPDTVGGNGIRRHIIDTANSMFSESKMVLKMHNDNYSDSSETTFFTEIMRIMRY